MKKKSRNQIQKKAMNKILEVISRILEVRTKNKSISKNMKMKRLNMMKLNMMRMMRMSSQY